MVEVLAVRVIPCLDIDAGRVVKGVRFAAMRDAGDPIESARRYEGQGGDEIVLLDVSAGLAHRAHAVETVAAVRAQLTVPLTVGGGIRTVGDASRLLEAGADKIAVNTAAVERPHLITELADRFGSQCIVLSVDAARHMAGWDVVVGSGRRRTGIDVVEWCRKGTAAGAGEILLTSWDRDGTHQGYDVQLISAVADAVTVPVIASGGASMSEDLAAAIEAGAGAVLVASILHDGQTTVGRLKRDLAARGMVVRP